MLSPSEEWFFSALLLWADSPPVLYQLFVPGHHAQNGQIFGVGQILGARLKFH
jgi:hypothetical protein